MIKWLRSLISTERKSQPDTCRHLDGGNQCQNPVTTSSRYFCEQHLKCRYRDCNNFRVGANDFCEQHGSWSANDLEVYKAIKETLLQDLREYWTRSNFYLLINAGLLSVFSTTVSSALKNQQTINPLLGSIDIALCVMGLSLVSIWFGVARSSLYWIREWRIQMIAISDVIDRREYYKKVVQDTMDNRRIPTRITLYCLSALFALGWVFLLIVTILLTFGRI